VINEFFFFKGEQSATLSLTCHAATLSLTCHAATLSLTCIVNEFISIQGHVPCWLVPSRHLENGQWPASVKRSLQRPSPSKAKYRSRVPKHRFQYELDRSVVLWRVLSEHRVVCSRDF
jgi:hypothetical protein